MNFSTRVYLNVKRDDGRQNDDLRVRQKDHGRKGDLITRRLPQPRWGGESRNVRVQRSLTKSLLVHWVNHTLRMTTETTPSPWKPRKEDLDEFFFFRCHLYRKILGDGSRTINLTGLYHGVHLSTQFSFFQFYIHSDPGNRVRRIVLWNPPTVPS